MKEKLFSSFFALFTITVSAQTNFDSGFNKGFSEGYCYGKPIGCISPMVPIAPIPKVGESSDSFQDGYNRGFVLGKSRADKTKEGTASNDRQRYRAEKVEHLQKPIYQPSSSLLDLQIASALQIRNMKPQIVQLMEDGKLQEAYNLTNQGLSRAPEDGEFIVLKGQILRKAKQYQDALVWFRKCARMRCMEGINYAIDATIKEMNENSTSSE